MLRAYRVGAVPIVFEAPAPPGGSGGAGAAAAAAGAAGAAAAPRPVPNYAQYFPRGSWINAAAFDSFEALGAHVAAVGGDKARWMSYHAHRDPATRGRRLDEWRAQHRARIGDPACLLAHSALAFVRAANRSGASGVPPMDRCLPVHASWPARWPKPTPPPPRAKDGSGAGGSRGLRRRAKAAGNG